MTPQFGFQGETLKLVFIQVGSTSFELKFELTSQQQSLKQAPQLPKAALATMSCWWAESTSCHKMQMSFPTSESQANHTWLSLAFFLETGKAKCCWLPAASQFPDKQSSQTGHQAAKKPIPTLQARQGAGLSCHFWQLDKVIMVPMMMWYMVRQALSQGLWQRSMFCDKNQSHNLLERECRRSFLFEILVRVFRSNNQI